MVRTEVRCYADIAVDVSSPQIASDSSRALGPFSFPCRDAELYASTERLNCADFTDRILFTFFSQICSGNPR